jgi:hypothetical protein
MAASSAQRLLEADLQRADFLVGVDKGHWSLLHPVSESEWPRVFTWVRAASRPTGPEQWLVRWDLAGYNEQSPTGAFWDVTAGALLPGALWPKAQADSVAAKVFRIDGWTQSGKAFYHPYDRLARHDHTDWPKQNPAYVWTNKNTLTDFIVLVHRWLNCEAYIGN